MPDKPTWLGRLDPAIAELRSLPWPWVDRATLERVLGVGRRRAQQLLAPLVRHQIGSNGVADREELIRHLEQMAAGQSGYYERRRRERFAETLEKLKESWTQQPRVLVEAPTDVINQEFADLPAGVSLRPGEIVVRFETAVEALEKLLALTMAAGNDLDRFERMVEPERTV
jgi:hypothetical protein